jgi:phage terminase large subunit-like protein
VAVAALFRGIHPVRSTSGPPKIWYSTTTYELFSQGAWPHLQKLLWWPWETPYKPGEWVKSVTWLRPGIPKAIHGHDGQEVTIKSFEQGPGEFQAAQLDAAILDEESPDSIWREIQARFLASSNPYILIPATPVLGVEWIGNLRRMAEEGAGGVGHHRLRTMDNPAHNAKAIEDLQTRFKDRPEELRLRLEGIPYYAQGLVYPDGLWQPAVHEVEPHAVDARDYTMYCCIDPGWRVCAALWVAIREDDSEFLVFRDYYGQELTVAENAQRIAKINSTMRIEGIYMDPAMTERHLGESRERIVDLFRAHGVVAQPAARHEVEAGIQVVSDLLAERGPDGQARFHVFKTCENFLRERRAYRRRAQREEGDVGKENPEKREDHLLDCVRYLAMQGLQFRVTRPPVPQPGSQGYLFWKQRHKSDHSDSL